MKINTKEIINILDKQNMDYSCNIKAKLSVNGFSPLRALKEGTITWINDNPDYNYENFELFNELIIVSHNKNKTSLEKTKHPCFFSKDPRSLFFTILEHYYPTEKYESKIDETAIVKTKKIGKNVAIGAYSFIDEEVSIGDNCIIRNHVSIEGRVTIGDYCIIDSGTVMGMAGFGYVKDANGNNKRVPHYGGISIGHHVEIGGNTCIARGCLDNTQIGNYVKIDNLCHIAHNDILKDNVQVIVAGIGGSTTIGENTWVGFHSVVNEGLNIGSNVVIGAGAAVTKDVKDGIVVAGVPAKYMRDTFDENGDFRR